MTTSWLNALTAGNENKYYESPELEQLKTLEILIGMIPHHSVNWLLHNENLEYYIANYGRADSLIEKLKYDIDQS